MWTDLHNEHLAVGRPGGLGGKCFAPKEGDIDQSHIIMTFNASAVIYHEAVGSKSALPLFFVFWVFLQQFSSAWGGILGNCVWGWWGGCCFEALRARGHILLSTGARLGWLRVSTLCVPADVSKTQCRTLRQHAECMRGGQLTKGVING